MNEALTKRRGLHVRYKWDSASEYLFGCIMQEPRQLELFWFPLLKEAVGLDLFGASP